MAKSNLPLSEEDRRRVRGWIAPLVARVVFAAIRLTDWIGGAKGITECGCTSVDEVALRAKRVDWLVFVFLVAAIGSYLAAGCPLVYVRSAALIVAGVITINALAVALNFALFRRWNRKTACRALVASHSRMVVLGLVNYIQVWIAFGSIYRVLASELRFPKHYKMDWFDPLYFSAVTQFTIGYGDISPTGSARAVVVVQVFSATLLLLLLVDRFVSMFNADISLDAPDAPSDNP